MKKIFPLLIFILLVKSSVGQTSNTIPYQSLLNLNPSFAGSNGGIRNQALTEVPSKKVDGMYNFSNGLDVYLPSLKSGIGVVYNYQRFGSIIKNQAAALMYAYHFQLRNKLKIIPSLQLGYKREEINYTWLYSPNGQGWKRDDHFSFSYGILFNFKNIYAGFSSSNVNYPERSGNKAVLSFYSRNQLHASYNLNVSENFHVNFCGQIVSENAYTRAMISANVLFFKYFLLGATRGENILGLNVGLRTDFFTVQASYKDYVGYLQPDYSPDYWQLMLSFNLRNKELRHAVTNFENW